jgi:hypothetical protein
MRAPIASALVVSTLAAQAAVNDGFNCVGDKLRFAINVKGQLWMAVSLGYNFSN